ncbi:MAG: amidohydrolase family protein [Streptosporangiales bacterium]|nr:amidohydrolase family protein [Streptosporangiales bacterium]
MGGNIAIVNGRVLTRDPSTPRAEAVLIRDGRVSLVGTTKDVIAVSGGADELDAGGRTVVPGFIDGHSHVEGTCVALGYQLPVHSPPYSSLAAIGDRIREERQNGRRGWLVCRSSFRLQEKVAEGRLFTRAELDAVSPDEPVGVLAGLHVAQLNTAAMKDLGVIGGEVPHGSVVHTDEAGEPTGVVTEISHLMPLGTIEETKDAIRAKFAELFTANGVTTVHTMPKTVDQHDALTTLVRDREIPVRARLYHFPWVTSVDQMIERGWARGDGDDFLRFGGVKVFIEGGHGAGGTLHWTEDELTDFLGRCHAADYQVFMHAVSEHGIRMTAKCIGTVEQRDPKGLRHRVEHGGDWIDPADIPWAQSTGALLVTTPQFMYSRGDLERNGAPLRSLIDAGFHPIGGSDSTGTVPDGIAPLFNIALAVARRRPDGSANNLPEAITLDEGLRLFTGWAAAGAFEENEKGALRPGLLGDAALLSHDIESVRPEELFGVSVTHTVLDGDVVFER